MLIKEIKKISLAESIISDTIIFYRTMQGIQLSAHAANPGDSILLDSEMNYNGLNNAITALDLSPSHSAVPELIDQFYTIVENERNTTADELSKIILQHWKLILITNNE